VNFGPPKKIVGHSDGRARGGAVAGLVGLEGWRSSHGVFNLDSLAREAQAGDQRPLTNRYHESQNFAS